MDLSPAFPGLSEKQRLYVQARMTGALPEVAARMAGAKVPERTWRLLEAAPVVRQALEKCREISVKETGITRKKISDMLEDAYHNATNSMEQIAAARELGKLHGLYEAQKVQVDHRVETIRTERELRALSVDELERLAHSKAEDFIDAEYVEVKQLEHVRG